MKTTKKQKILYIVMVSVIVLMIGVLSFSIVYDICNYGDQSESKGNVVTVDPKLVTVGGDDPIDPGFTQDMKYPGLYWIGTGLLYSVEGYFNSSSPKIINLLFNTPISSDYVQFSIEFRYLVNGSYPFKFDVYPMVINFAHVNMKPEDINVSITINSSFVDESKMWLFLENYIPIELIMYFQSLNATFANGSISYLNLVDVIDPTSSTPVFSLPLYYDYDNNVGNDILDPDDSSGDLSITINCNVASDPLYELGYNEGYAAGHCIGHDEGYVAGQKAGYNSGYTSGQNAGYDSGYTVGYNEGLNKGQSDAFGSLNPLSLFFEPVQKFLDTPFFGKFTFGSVFGVLLFVALAIMFIRMFGGG